VVLEGPGEPQVEERPEQSPEDLLPAEGQRPEGRPEEVPDVPLLLLVEERAAVVAVAEVVEVVAEEQKCLTRVRHKNFEYHARDSPCCSNLPRCITTSNHSSFPPLLSPC
jgi:hypothetical protein